MVPFRNEETFRVFNTVFSFSGVRLYNIPNSFIYTILVIFVNFCSCSTALALVVNIYVNQNDLDKAVDSIYVLPPIALAFWIQVYLRFRRDKLVRLLSFADCFVWEDLPPEDPVTGNTGMAVWIRRIRTTAVRVAVLGPGIYFLQIITQMFIKEERFLNLDAWYPYDWTKSPAYELTILTQVIGVLGNCSIVYVFPPLYATLVVIACSQLEKVRIALSSIKQQYIAAETTSPNDEQWQLRASDDDFTRMEGQLNKCIRLHQEIIRFIMELEENFSTLFVGVFLILMLSLCFSTFSAVLRWGNAVNVSLSLQSYCMYLIFIFLFCWFPSELTDQGERVRDAAWSCDWIGTPVSFQRSLSLVIASANKEFILTAGKCVPVSKQTMLNMIQESISLFMFLMQVRGEDESEE